MQMYTGKEGKGKEEKRGRDRENKIENKTREEN